MDTNKDYYAILGVLPIAEEIVIRAAYKALAQRYHPDRSESAPENAHQRMKEINEAYSILSDHVKRKDYDKARGSSTQSGDMYFQNGSDDIPPSYDPLENDWALATKYYADLIDLNARLSKISWRLAYSFRAYLLEEKVFENREQVATEMENEFLKLYFGSDPNIIGFAKSLITEGHTQAAKALNEAVRIFGSKIDANRVIKQIQEEFLCPSPPTDKAMMEKHEAFFDGARYRYL